MAKAYYNEIDKFAAQWLRNLIDADLIAPGDVDERSIEDVTPNDLDGYTQCHFFAGIGVWSYALRQAGWPDNRPVWTGSCPCQPFSNAGKAGGFADERHLWPAFHHLIEKRRPPVVLGEQVASTDGLDWLDLVQVDLEASGYASGAFDLCAAGVGAPHMRQRLFWVGDTVSAGLEGHSWHGHDSDEPGRLDAEQGGSVAEAGIPTCKTAGFWEAADWLPFLDGKWRPVEPGAQPVAYGTSNTVGRIRAYGNAIVAPVAIEFIKAYMETVCGRLDNG